MDGRSPHVLAPVTLSIPRSVPRLVVYHRTIVIAFAFLAMLVWHGSAEAVPSGSRIPWQGNNWYLHGANIPWYNWGRDFGGGSGNGGVSSAGSQTVLAAKLAQARDSGIHTIRWWVFPGSPWQVTRDAAGAPTGISSTVYADFDAALALAETYDLYFNFVLFSAPTAIPSSWITDSTARAKLATALGALFARYKTNPRVMSWEIFNEPELDIWNGKIAKAPVQATVKAIATAVHANSPAYVTVGSAMLDGLGMWVGQGLDYYQAHWYDYMSGGNWCARCTDYATVKARYNLDAPLVIGEFYASSTVDAAQRFADFYQKGYAGAWPWSLFPDRTSDNLAINLAAARTFAGQHADAGPRGGAVSPPPPPPPAGPVVSDTFTGTSGTLLEQHTGETGATWTRHPASTGSLVLSDSGRVLSSGSSSTRALYFAGGVPGQAAYDVSADLVVKSLDSSAAGVTARVSPTADLYYLARYNGVTRAWELYRTMYGGMMLLGSYRQTLTPGTTYRLTLHVTDTTKQLLVNGVVRVTSSDNSITAAGRGGVRVAGVQSNTTGYHLDNLTVE
jgi:hypothetical protein